jgi:tRNA-splicing ligase RtcB (3'-phosphate/5'-hydroxy nucleic acid ligase)
LNIDDFEKSMSGIWSSCINKDTIDEAPLVYKNKDEILKYITESVDIDFIMKPLYNFKAGGD